MLNIKYTEKLIDSADVVSFDLYGTLIKRKVSKSTNVFDIVEKRYNMLIPCGVSNFREKRIFAEKKCRKNSKSEITLEQIYEELNKVYNCDMSKIMNIEREVEIQLSYVSEEVLKLYYYAVKKNKKVFLISDMYLNEKFIRNILYKNGVTDGSLYVSSQYGYTKSSGMLYDIIREKEKININDKWIHIGDNLKSDIIRAYQHHIHPVWIKNKISVNDDIYLCIESKSELKAFGYNIIGPLMAGFVSWLHQEFIDNKIKKVFFFSREGWFIKTCYEAFFENSSLEKKYLYVSRKSLITPILSEKEIFGNISRFRPIGIKNAYEYLLSMGFEKSEAETFLIEHCIDKNSKADKIFCVREELRDELSKINRDRAELLNEYFQNQGVNGRIATVDVGWTGTMQVALETNLNIHNIEHDVYGFFLAQRPEMEDIILYGIKNKGWLCDFKGPKRIQDILLSGTCLLELIFMAPHGTTIGYSKDEDGKVEPVLAQNEYENNFKAISIIQESAVAFLNDYKKLYCGLIVNSKEDFFGRLRRFLCNPDRNLAKTFGEMPFYDSGIHRIAPQVKALRIISFIKGYNISFWKTGYLKRNFRIKLPYMAIYRVTRIIGLKFRKIKG